MSYTKQTWVNKPTLTTPVGASRLNHMEDGIYEAVTQNPERTLTLPHSNGGLGGTVTTAIAAATAGGARFVIKLPVDVATWRLSLRNRDVTQGAKTAATLKRVVVGQHQLATTGTAGETGSFVGNTANVILSTDTPIPGDGSWCVLAPVSAAGSLPAANAEFLLGYAYTFAASTSVQTGAGKAWHWTNATSATDPTVSGSGATAQYIPFDWKIEYTTTSRRRVCLVIGDSIYEPITGGNSTLAPASLWRGPAQVWAAGHNRLLVNMSLAGITLQNFAADPASDNVAAYIWNRQDLTGYTIDEVLITAGSNDFSQNGRSLLQMQADVLTIVNRLRTMGISAPVYMGTLLARGATGDAVRVSYNEWLAALPSFCAGVIDFDGAMRGTTAQNLVDQYTPDGIHPSLLGARRMAAELGVMLP